MFAIWLYKGNKSKITHMAGDRAKEKERHCYCEHLLTLFQTIFLISFHDENCQIKQQHLNCWRNCFSHRNRPKTAFSLCCGLAWKTKCFQSTEWKVTWEILKYNKSICSSFQLSFAHFQNTKQQKMGFPSAVNRYASCCRANGHNGIIKRTKIPTTSVFPCFKF